MYKLSVITINYNNVDGLSRTFNSVFSQTNSMFEFIVIDGGSNDGSKELIEEFSERINYWVSESDRGIYHAMNKGIAKANGEYILFLNGGDSFHNELTVENCLPELKEEDIIGGNQNMIVQHGESFLGKNPDEISFYTLFRYTLWHQSTFIRRECFAELGGYDENVRITADWKWSILAICLFKKTYKKIDLIVADFYMDGISSDPNNSKEMADEKDAVYRTYFNIFWSDYDRFLKLDYHIEDLRRSRLFKVFKFVKKVMGKSPVEL